jgi:outer membrane biosynthesis protein TonB
MVSREHFDAMMREQEQTQSAGIAELQRQHGNLAAMVKDLTGNVHMLYESFERVGDAVGKLQEHVQEQGALLQQRLPLTPPRPDRQRRQPPAAAHQQQQQPLQPPQPQPQPQPQQKPPPQQEKPPQPRPTFASPLLARVLAVSSHLDIFGSPSSDWSDQEGEEGSDEDDAQMVGGAGQQHRNGRLAKRKRRNAQI